MQIGDMWSIGVLAAAAVVAAALPPQDAPAKAKGGTVSVAVPGAQDHGAMLEAMKKAGALGEQHKDFAEYVGNWQVQYTCWMDPSTPQEGSGTSAFEAILGGRYLVEHASGTMPAMGPFQGMGILGFNNLTGEYEHVWLCDTGTAIMTSRGKAGADGAVTLSGEMVDPQTKANLPCRMVWKEIGPNERQVEMYCTQSGQESKMMQAVYTRGELGMR